MRCRASSARACAIDRASAALAADQPKRRTVTCLPAARCWLRASAQWSGTIMALRTGPKLPKLPWLPWLPCCTCAGHAVQLSSTYPRSSAAAWFSKIAMAVFMRLKPSFL